MSLIPNNPTYVAKSLIWNTLSPSHHELPHHIDDYGDDDDDLSPMSVESEETDYTW
jgi:hypothetical protein